MCEGLYDFDVIIFLKIMIMILLLNGFFFNFSASWRCMAFLFFVFRFVDEFSTMLARFSVEFGKF